MSPHIIDPSSRPLPLMQTIQDAARLNIQEHTTFYVSAFLFQCWISELTNSAQLAEKPDPKDRSFQTGQAWRGFLKFFGKASDAEFPVVFSHLMEFAQYDDPLANHIVEAGGPLAIEHDLTGEFVGSRTPPALRNNPRKLLALIRSTTTRLCDWLDCTLQFRVFLEWHILPDSFDPDPQKRELASLAHNQRNFAVLNEHSRAHWLNHMSDLVQELPNSSKWAAFRQISSAPAPVPRPWPTEHLDRAIIKLWPLFKRYHWSAADLLCILTRVLDPGGLAPCPNEAALAAYCAGTLGLRHVGLKSRRSPRSEIPAANVALRLCAPEPENPSHP